MLRLLPYTFLIVFFSCSSSPETIKQEQEVTSGTIINPGDLSDISIYPSQPYYQEEAGYNGGELTNLPAERNVNFEHVDGTSDTVALETLITTLSNNGGGKIRIKSGDYRFRDVLLKSNVHITIESNTTIKLENQDQGKNAINGFRQFFSLSGTEVGKPLENVKIIGLGTPNTRPKLVVEKFAEVWGEAFNRAISFGYVKNALVENLTIVDNYTLGAAIAFNPVDLNNDGETADLAENVTIANVSLSKASIGYGLIQTNVGRNILLKNLSCEGGMTCRIEAHTGRQYDLGVYNIVVKNVASINGKAAVLLQPHSVLNGRILVDKAKSEGSSWTLFLKEGFVGADSKRREKGSFASNSEFKNISLASNDNTATLSYKNYSFIPLNLKPLYFGPNFVLIPEDSNHTLNNGVPGNESPIVGPSVAVVYIDASYPMILPIEKDLVLTGKTDYRLKILKQ